MTTGESDMSVERSNPEARRSLRTSRRSDSNSSSGSAGSGFGRKTISNIRPPVTQRATNPNADISSQADEEGSELANDDDEDSDEKPNELAPSDGLKRRGHQTGLSLSLANASLGKRGRSPGMEEEVERPMSKMSKTSATADSSSDEDDDDNDYNAVDDISDSDEDNDVEELEEKMIIESEEEETSDQIRRGSQSSVDSIFGLDGVEETTLQADNHNFFNELFPDAANATMGEDENDHDDATPVRRVRFAEEVQLHSNSSTTTETDDDDDDDDDDEDEEISYPDLFLQQDSLDPAFCSLMEQKDHDDRSSDGDSYWDFENEQDVQGLDEDSSSDSGSSGYETDEGETTDEEIIPPRTVSKPNTSLRHNTRTAGRLRATTAPSATPARKASAGVIRRGPLMGSFLVDDDKPIAVVDGHGKHMLFFPAPKHRRQAAQSSVIATSSPAPSSVTTYNLASETESDVGFSQTDPMLSSPANVMMTGFGNGRNRANSHLSSEITGPPEAFFPFTSINSNGIVETDNLDDDSADEYTDEEENLRIEDFINFGDDSSSSDEAQDQYESTGSNTANEDGKGVEMTPQSKRSKIPGFKSRSQSTPTPTNPGSLLEHFDKGVVSSFRRNNDRHKMWTRNSSSVGIKGGRLHVADTPISPLRRRRGGSNSSGVGRSPLRPQQNVSNTSPPQPSPHHQFGGPLKKRIQNSNHMKRGRKGTL